MSKSHDLFEAFTGHEANEELLVNIPDVKEALVIGRLDGVIYTTIRDGVEEKYIHEFKNKSAPLLCAAGDGATLLIIGGNFKFTQNGIEDY